MTNTYDLLQKEATVNKQLYTLLRFACQCEHATALTLNTWEAATVFAATRVKTAKIFNLAPIDEPIINLYKELAPNVELAKLEGDIEPTDILYINTPAEGNYRASELTRHAKNVRKYILLPNTVTNAHQPSNNIKLAEGITPIGLAFGINHFLQNNDNWFILEHDDIDPGMTILVNRDNVSI